MSAPSAGEPGPWTLETIIGPLLSTRADPLRAEITYTEHDRPTRPTRHRVWLEVKGVYRHEQPPAPTVLQHRTGSSLVSPDGTVQRGPRISAGGHSPLSLLHPRDLYIWGRTGEDWRLTSAITPIDPTHLRVELVSTEGHDDSAHIEVDTTRWVITTVTTPSDTWRITHLEDLDMDPATFLAETHRLRA